MSKSADKTPEHTPLMEQFSAAQVEPTDALPFFWRGDFYEPFHDDARKAARARQTSP